MDKRKQTRVTVSRSEVTLIRKMQGTATANCLGCQARIEMATPDQAVTFAGIRSRARYEGGERTRVHFIETSGAHLLVCLDSLRAAQAESL